MRLYFRFGIVLILLSALVACAAPRLIWTSVPEIARSSAEIVDVQIKPLKLDEPFFIAFELTVHNTTAIPLEINWNETRFVYGKKNLGIFVFQGIKPEDIKNKTIPNEVIGPGETMVKRLSPARTIAWLPQRLTANADAPSFSPGILPNGINSISLLLSQNGRTWRQTLSVRIVETKIPSKP